MTLIMMHDWMPFEQVWYFNIALYTGVCSSYDLVVSYGTAYGPYIDVTSSSYALVAHHKRVLVGDLSCRQLSLKNPVKPFPEFRWFGWSGGVQYIEVQFEQY